MGGSLSESKASLWITIAVLFAGVIASFVTLREQTGNHEKLLTDMRSDIRDIQHDNSLSNKLHSLELNIETLTQQIKYQREEIQDLKNKRYR
jgi:hypothetical protein